MLIAIPKEGQQVCPHFGHCEQFAIYDTSSDQYKVIDNPGHVPGALPGFLQKQGVNLVIAGGMGQRAQELFAAQNIKVIVGINGPIEEAVEKFKQGELVSSGAVCTEHEHAGDCHGGCHDN